MPSSPPRRTTPALRTAGRPRSGTTPWIKPADRPHKGGAEYSHDRGETACDATRPLPGRSTSTPTCGSAAVRLPWLRDRPADETAAEEAPDEDDDPEVREAAQPDGRDQHGADRDRGARPQLPGTVGFAGSGSHSSAGACSARRPSSTGARTAAAVTGLLTDAIRKIESGRSSPGPSARCLPGRRSRRPPPRRRRRGPPDPPPPERCRRRRVAAGCRGQSSSVGNLASGRASLRAEPARV